MCNYSRCNELMRARPWEVVEDFYERIAAGTASLDDLQPLTSCDELVRLRDTQALESVEERQFSSKQATSLDICEGEVICDQQYGLKESLQERRESAVPPSLDSTIRDGVPALFRGTAFLDRVASGLVPKSRRQEVLLQEESGKQLDAKEQAVEDNDRQGKAQGGISEGSERQFERRNFKIQLAYSGRHFWGWQKQTGHETVQDSLERALRSVLDRREGSRKERQQETPAKSKAKKKEPIETTNASVAGRTDKAVSASGQVVSWYTRYTDVDYDEIAHAINREAPGLLRAVKVTPVDRTFHAQFSAKWRSYVYLFPLCGGELQSDGSILLQPPGSPAPHQPRGTVNKIQPSVLDVRIVDRMMRTLEGRSISYGSYARDTRSERSSGPAVVCHLFKARAELVTLPLPIRSSPAKRLPALRFSLVGNRFLHRMVRVLVATAIREAATGSCCQDALSRLSSLDCRRATAPPAPPYGLMLAEVGYAEYCG